MKTRHKIKVSDLVFELMEKEGLTDLEKRRVLSYSYTKIMKMTKNNSTEETEKEVDDEEAEEKE